MNYVIDLSAAADKREIHDILARALDLPDYYGRNLDALWDCLTGDLEIPCEIRLTVSENIPYLNIVCEVFEDAQAWHARRGHDVRLLINRT